MDVCTEESVADKLITVVAFCFQKLRLNISARHGERVWIYIERSVFFIVNTLLFIYDVLVKSYLNFTCIGCLHPVDGSFYLTSVRCISTFGFRIISTVNHTDRSVIICFISCAGYKICIHKTDFISDIKTFVFLRRLCHEIITFDIKFSAERDLSSSKFLVLHVVRSFQVLNLSFRIIVDHKLDRIKDRHHTWTFQFQILADAVLKHCVIHRTVGLGNATELYEFTDGFRCKSAAAKCGD